MYCGYRTKLCSGKAGYANLDFNEGGELWVCAQCSRPTKTYTEATTDMYAPRNAVAWVGEVHDADGRVMLRWATSVPGQNIYTMNFIPYPRKVGMPTQSAPGRNPLVKWWHDLDAEIDLIRGTLSTADAIALKRAEDAKVRATTLAEVLAHIMSPFYEGAEVVLRESMARWEARQGGIDHESPGLAESIWDPGTRWDGTNISREAEERVRNGGVRTITPAKLDDQKTTFVQHALETGSMTAENLAKMFGVSLEVIKACVDAE